MTTSTPRAPITECSITPPHYRCGPKTRIRSINWNRVDNPKDHEAWSQLTSNFWLSEKVPLSNDLPSWHMMIQEEHTLTMRVFISLTVLDTVQAAVDEISQIRDARTEHEGAICTNIAFTQAVHVRSYSSILSTLCSSEEIGAAYEWAVNNGLL